MIIKTDGEFEGIRKISNIVASVLKEMKEYARVGMTTKDLDDFGAGILKCSGAVSAPFETYKFPGCTCISINNEMAHGIPSRERTLKDGDLVNIDVSAVLDGFYADNGASFILGDDVNNNRVLLEASVEALYNAISVIKGGVRIAEAGKVIEETARGRGFKVIRNLGGHGVGRGLHEEPDYILNYYDRYDKRRFKTNSIVAVETFLSTRSWLVNTSANGWTLTGNKGGFCVQHEHTVMVTSGEPVILTGMNGI